jgi:hypothetical protein
MKNFIFSLLVLVSFEVYCQDDAIILVIPSVDSKILLDGLEKGVSKSGSSVRIVASPGEHYVEAQPVDATLQTKGEVVTLESKKQEILKIQFEVASGTKVEPIKVADLNISLPGIVTVAAWASDHPNQNYSYPTQWFAFEKGDEIIIDATMSNKNGTNVINVLTYPDQVVRYSNNAFTELKDVRIKVEQRGIFAFVLGTNHAFDRNCFLKIHRRPAGAEFLSFNSTVALKRIYTPFAVHEPQDFFINGGVNAAFGGKSRVTLSVTLPENTVEWYYRFSASRNKEDIENVKSNFRLFSEIATATLGLTGIGAAISDGIFNNLAQPPGADFCDIYLLPSEHGSTFEAKNDDQWRHYPDAARQNFKSGNVRVTCCSSGQFYLGIRNPSSNLGINVSVEVVAITVKEDYVMEYAGN